jgi:hypothetical protein
MVNNHLNARPKNTVIPNVELMSCLIGTSKIETKTRHVYPKFIFDQLKT